MTAVEHLVSSQNKLGEGPLWDMEEQTLYWVDIELKRVEQYNPQTQARQSYTFPHAVTALGLREKGGFVTATSQGLAYWRIENESLSILGNPEADLPGNRFNDGAVGPGGRFWAGTMFTGPHDAPHPPGSLYRLDPGIGVTQMETGLTISNGLGWSPDQKTMYLTDSLKRAIYAYDFDAESGQIENRRTLIDSSEEEGVPDGLAVDSEGFIWSARWGGWKITRYDPEGKPEREISLPVEFPTSCAFGGPELNELYITSAWTAVRPEERPKQPFAGDLFRAQLDIKGQEVYRYAG